MARLRCCSLLGMADSSSGNFRSSWAARYTSARRSFGKQEPPKANPGFRYAGEMFSFTSSTKRSHHFMAIHAHLLAQRANLVGERDFYRVEGVGSILDHLRGPQGHKAGFDSERLIQVRDAPDGRAIVAADHQQRGLEEIPDCGPLAQKLRMRYDADGRGITESRLAPNPRRYREKQCSGSRQSEAWSGLRPVRRSPPPHGAIGAVLNCRSFPTEFRRKPARCRLPRLHRPRWKLTASPRRCFLEPVLPAPVHKRAHGRFELRLPCVHPGRPQKRDVPGSLSRQPSRTRRNQDRVRQCDLDFRFSTTNPQPQYGTAPRMACAGRLRGLQ